MTVRTFNYLINYPFAGSNVKGHEPVQDGFVGGSVGQIHGEWDFRSGFSEKTKASGESVLGASLLNVLRQYEAMALGEKHGAAALKTRPNATRLKCESSQRKY